VGVHPNNLGRTGIAGSGQFYFCGSQEQLALNPVASFPWSEFSET
jgi:hypothetical protein